jgi:sensor histidine kinase YesM
MSIIEKIFGKETIKWSNYVTIVFLASLPMFFTLMFIAGTINRQNDEEIALAGTAIFVLGIFCGRFLALLWKPQQIKNEHLIAMAVLILILVALMIPVLSTLENHQEVIVLGVGSILFFSISLFSGILIKLGRDKIKSQINAAETKAETSKSELQLLQSQLSPHFLFNTLNNLYGLSLNEHEKLPPLLLKLSELLRYSVYEAKELYVPIKEEITYINNYIDFEKLRIGERLELKLDLEEISNTTIKIAPMMLIVFVENAFKHAKNTQDEKIFVEISLKQWGNSLLFAVKNSFKASSKSDNKASGLGLENVKKRLQLLYPNAHDLAINESEDTFELNLRVNVK